MKSRMDCFLITIFMLLVLSGCVSWRVSTSSPDKRYDAYWNDKIRTRCYDDQFGKRQCDYMAPPWEMPRLMYSVLAPKGEWDVYSVNAKDEAGYAFVMMPNESNGYYLYDVDVSLHPVIHENHVEQVQKILGNNEHQKNVMARANNLKNDDAFVRNRKAKDIEGQVVDIGALKCGEVSWSQHIGPSPDPKEGGQWSGMGAYKKNIWTKCYLKGPELYWLLRIRYFFTLSDNRAQSERASQSLVDPFEAEKDLRRRLDRMFESLEFNGLHQ